MDIEKAVKGARHIEQVRVHMNADYFEKEKRYIEERKKKFEFVKSYENFDLYKHIKARLL